MIILLIWLWISNSAVLPGAEFNADLQWGRAIAPESSRPGTIRRFRDTRKLRKKDGSKCHARSSLAARSRGRRALVPPAQPERRRLWRRVPKTITPSLRPLTGRAGSGGQRASTGRIGAPGCNASCRRTGHQRRWATPPGRGQYGLARSASPSALTRKTSPVTGSASSWRRPGRPSAAGGGTAQTPGRPPRRRGPALRSICRNWCPRGSSWPP